MSDDLTDRLRALRDDELPTAGGLPDRILIAARRRQRRRRAWAGLGTTGAAAALAVALLSVGGNVPQQARIAPAADRDAAVRPHHVQFTVRTGTWEEDHRTDLIWGSDGSVSPRPEQDAGAALLTPRFLSAEQLQALRADPAGLPAALTAAALQVGAERAESFAYDAAVALLDPYTPAALRRSIVTALLDLLGTTSMRTTDGLQLQTPYGDGFVNVVLDAHDAAKFVGYVRDGQVRQLRVLETRPLAASPVEPTHAAATPQPLPSGTDGCPQQVPVRRTPLDVVTVLDCRVTLVGRDLVRQHRHATAAEASALLAALRRPDVPVPFPSGTACNAAAPPPEPALTLVLSDGSRVTPRWTKGICSRLQGLEEYGATAFTVDSSEVLVREVAGPAVSPTP